MSVLEMKARAVVAAWDTGNLAAAVRSLAQELEEQYALRQKYAAELRAISEDLAKSNEVDMDDAPLISETEENGFWAEAWIWVPTEEEQEDDR